MTATKGTKNMSFAYDEEGIRISKTVNGVTTNYYYQGSMLYAEETNSEIIVYFYDQNGAPIGFQYRGADYANGAWDLYAYEKNIFGDIVAVYDESGNKIVYYTYDAWGECTVTNCTTVPTAVANNPYRYRGYYYDSDLGMYYLQSRYYDANICRFINADGLISGVSTTLQGYNLYVYCFNNPIAYTDSNGDWPKLSDVWGWIEDNIIDPVKEFYDDISEDIYNYDKDNTDENVVLESNYFSSYKGVPVIRTNGDRSGSFGVIFLTRETNSRRYPEDVLRHEYGHTKQLEQLGIVNYALCIGLPSWQEWGTGEYYSKPWEITADIYGGVQSRNHSQSNIDRGFAYLEGSKIIGALIWVFI